jgi:hypothetical protein
MIESRWGSCKAAAIWFRVKVSKIPHSSNEFVEYQAQRAWIIQPKFATNELPWVIVQKYFNPNGVASTRVRFDKTPMGF